MIDKSVSGEADKYKHAVKWTETKSRQRPAMWRDVIAPALCTVALFLLGGWGIGLIVAEINVNDPDPITIGVALALILGSIAGIAIGAVQLYHFNQNQYVVTEWFRAEDKKPEPRKRIMQPNGPPANNRRTYTLGRYYWSDEELKKFAKMMINDRGEWVGPGRLTRELLKDIIINYTENYPIVLDDFQRSRVVDKAKDFTDWGRWWLRQFRGLPFPPAPIERSAVRAQERTTTDDD